MNSCPHCKNKTELRRQLRELEGQIEASERIRKLQWEREQKSEIQADFVEKPDAP